MAAERTLPDSAPEEPKELGELTHDAIAGTFRIWQRLRGHRYSLDDVLTAYVGASAAPDARDCLELGSGIGSVLLMLAYKLQQARFVAIEAQRNSFALLTRNVRDNGLENRVTCVHGDLRDAVSQLGGTFQLITGTPPYVPPGKATPSTDAQRAYARQEFRGGVEEYVRAGAKVLAPGGRLVVCGDARSPERVERAASETGLVLVRQLDAVPRAGHKGALFSVFTLAHALGAPSFMHAPPFVARDEQGARTAEYINLREFFGMSAPIDEPASP